MYNDKMGRGNREWRKLYNEELNDLVLLTQNFSGDKSRKMLWSGHVVRMGERRGVYRVWVGKPEVKRPLGRPRRRWGDNIEMDLSGSGMWGYGLD